MKNSILFTLLVFCLHPIFSQTQNSSWGIQLIPELNTQIPSGEVGAGTFNVNQSVGLSLGVAYRYHLNDWLNIESGLLVRRRVYNFSVGGILLPAGLDPRNGISYTSIRETVSLGLISIPGKLRIQLGNGFSADAGISLDVPFHQDRNREIINGFDDPALQQKRGVFADYLSFTAGFFQQVKMKSGSLEIGPRFDLSTHQIEVPFNSSNERQLSIGFQLTFIR